MENIKENLSNVKNIIKMKTHIFNFVRWIYRKTIAIINIIVSMIRISFYSKHKIKIDIDKKISKLHIFGNGPSLKEFIDNNIDYLMGKDILVVNDFFINIYFTQLKPLIYVIADPMYFLEKVNEEKEALRKRMKRVFLEDVNWDMYFFVPTNMFKMNYFQKLYRDNPHIKILPFNTTPFIGPQKLKYRYYDKLLAKPISGNVIGSALYIALQLKLKEILLFGVEHSWSKSLYVNVDNYTCIKEEHFYSTAENDKIWLKYNDEPYMIHEALYDIAKMLGGYREINDYAHYKDIEIINYTTDSFIDAFRKEKWENNQNGN